MNTRCLWVLLLSVPSLSACASATPAPASGSEELMFSLPNWCGRTGKRQKWDDWAVARDRAPTGTGICGVRVDVVTSGTTEEGEAGLCVTLEKGTIANLELRQHGAALLPEQVVGMPARDDYATVRARIDQPGGAPREADIRFRFVGSTITAVDPDGKTTTGPCFWKLGCEVGAAHCSDSSSW